jgi:hypothetical protein
MAQVIAVPYANLQTWELTQRYFAFFVDGESLYLNSSVDGGVTWTWQALGSPLGSSPASVGSTPSVTAFPGNVASDGSVIWQFYVFVTFPTDPSNFSNPNELWVNISLDDGNTWNWYSQGAPPQGGSPSAPALNGFPSPDPEVVSRQSVNSPFEWDVYCHVIGTDGRLYVNYSEDNGQTWQWADRGLPPGTELSWNGPQSSISYFDYTNQRIYYFAVGIDKNLYANYGDGTTWSWLNLGQPPGTSVAPWGAVSSGMSSLTYLSHVAKSGGLGGQISANEEIWVFVIGGSGDLLNQSSYQLYACYSPANGAGWRWETLGSPSGNGLPYIHTALLVSNESNAGNFTENVFLFATGADLNAYADFTPDASLGSAAGWTWQPLGLPPNTPFVIFRAAVASTEVEASLASVQMFVFGQDEEGDIRTLRWDGSAWTWYDQQGP